MHWLRTIGWAAIVGFVGLVAAGLGVIAVIYAMVYFGDDSSLKKTTIMARINEETTIVCNDGVTSIGSFFANEHRRYVPIEEVPPAMINALVAAEDKNFFKHGGIDPPAIIKAFFEGLQTGHFRGGSTLTQQTVKNILDRWEYSLKRKIREAIAALQLERLYNKKQILEFYLNQFHVSGNGNGIGIAAKYYFNKDVRDLGLVESAFIAGSVKGPSKYDPFIKYTKERREQAVRNAFERKNYVLRRMYEQGWITEKEFKEAWAMAVPFNRGSFRSSEVALVSLVRSQLERRDILDSLGLESVDDLNTSGLKVYTTLDCQLQEAAQLAMRRNLSRLETILQGFKAEPADRFRRLRDLTINDFYFGRVEQITGGIKDAQIKVSFGLSSGIIPFDSLKRYAMLLDLPYLEGPDVQLKRLLQQIKVGDILFVEVKEYDKEKHEGVLELNKRPVINGGLVAIDKGEVRVAVSGFDTKGYNRAMFAKRPPGSVFKSVVFYASLQLGWSVLDRLDNERQIFPYQGRFYFPRPDHASPYKDVSMIWAGTMSENLASVHLTAKLVDKLNFEQFKQLMSMFDLLPHASEPARDFHFRVARALGVQLDNEGVREYQLSNAVNELAPDLVFAGQNDVLRKLNKMWWGKGYTGELQSIYVQEGDAMPVYEKALRIGLLKNNFIRISSMSAMLSTDWDLVVKRVAEKGPEGAFADPSLQAIWRRFKVLASVGNRPALGYFADLDGEVPRRDYRSRFDIERIAQVPGRPLNGLDVQAIWAGGAFSAADITLNDVHVDGYLPLSVFKKLQTLINEKYDLVMAKSDEYDLLRYFQHHDFRIALGLKFLTELVKSVGVTSKIEPVLSFPLGTNDVTAAEVAKIYQTFVSGKIYKYFDKGPPNQLNFVRKIEDRFGNVVLEPKRLDGVITIPEYSHQMREILKRVVTHGTGKRARGELFVNFGDTPNTPIDPKAKPAPSELKPIRVPAFGKTGTTNDYTNAYFAGFFPMPTEKGVPLEFDNSMVIASYVGYDLNRTMRRGAVKISGGLGALPAWIDFAKAMIEKYKYKDFIDPLDLNVIAKGEWPMRYDATNSFVKLDLPRGTVLNESDETDSEVFGVTEIGKTGERPDNEFAIGSTVRAVARIPQDRANGGPLRIFSPFKTEAEGVNAVPASPVIIDSRTIPNVAFPTDKIEKNDSNPAPAPAVTNKNPAVDSQGRPVQSPNGGALELPGSKDNANGYTGPAVENEAAPLGAPHSSSEDDLFDDMPAQNGVIRQAPNTIKAPNPPPQKGKPEEKTNNGGQPPEEELW